LSLLRGEKGNEKVEMKVPRGPGLHRARARPSDFVRERTHSPGECLSSHDADVMIVLFMGKVFTCFHLPNNSQNVVCAICYK
jgi:hypothetical protein